MSTHLLEIRGALAALLLSAAACAPAPPAAGPSPVPELPAPEPEDLGPAPTELEEPVRAPAHDLLGTAEYDLPVEANNWVEAELDFLVGERAEVIEKWLRQGAPYEAFVKETLRETGIPTDLYHLAMIESGFVPTARSHAGAVGMWQFMPATGRGMGLRIDSEIDERMDPVRSTRAAARHLRALHDQLDDWALAAAAYNAGSGRITRGMQSFAAHDFWQLAEWGDLAEETKRYIPRLFAVTVIAKDRERFGLEAAAAAQPFAFDSVMVEYATPIGELARITDIAADRLARLNPHLRAGRTPAGGYWVWVPTGEGVAAQRAWLASDFRKHQGYGTYVVRWGDNLGLLAERSGLAGGRIRELNDQVDFDRLQVGEELKLPYAVAEALTARAMVEETAVATRSGPSDGASRSHTVASGETLWGIARKYGVGIDAIRTANELPGSTIRPGQSLRIPTESAEATEAASAEYVVRTGDSLWSIARRYGSTVNAIRTANELGDDPIQPGQRLRVPRGSGD